MKRIKNLLLFLCLILGIFSCATEGCYEDTESDLVISLNESDDETQTTIDSISVYGLGMESDSLYKKVSTETLFLPLDAGSDYSTFVVVNGLVKDTISINYMSKSNFISKGCGYNFLYTIESITFTKNKIDTILIINNNVSPDDEENLRTFFESDNS